MGLKKHMKTEKVQTEYKTPVTMKRGLTQYLHNRPWFLT